jgi:hypothetical protein
MLMPPKNDFSMLPSTPEARRLAGHVDAAQDTGGNECRSYGAASIMRIPGPAAHPLGRRQHAADRHRLRHADADAAFRRFGSR